MITMIPTALTHAVKDEIYKNPISVREIAGKLAINEDDIKVELARLLFMQSIEFVYFNKTTGKIFNTFEYGQMLALHIGNKTVEIRDEFIILARAKEQVR